MKRQKKSKHGGKRPGAGRKVGGCSTCAILKQQLAESAERERRLIKMLDKKDDQIGMVVQSKFDTVRVANLPMPEDQKPLIPLDQLTDVTHLDDQDFVNTVAGMTH